MRVAQQPELGAAELGGPSLKQAGAVARKVPIPSAACPEQHCPIPKPGFPTRRGNAGNCADQPQAQIFTVPLLPFIFLFPPSNLRGDLTQEELNHLHPGLLFNSLWLS